MDINGSFSDDYIVGTDQADIIRAEDGDDVVYAVDEVVAASGRTDRMSLLPARSLITMGK